MQGQQFPAENYQPWEERLHCDSGSKSGQDWTATFVVFKGGVKELKTMQSFLKQGYKILTTAVISGGCSKYIQTPDVWNKLFKASLHKSYDNWMSGETDKIYTAGRNMRASARCLFVAWVLKFWEKLDIEMVKKILQGDCVWNIASVCVYVCVWVWKTEGVKETRRA